jgi:putative transposase
VQNRPDANEQILFSINYRRAFSLQRPTQSSTQTLSWTRVGILKQSEAGAKTSELCRQHGISAATFYGWRSKYGGMDVSEAKRLKQLEEENSKLKRIVADQALDITMLKDLVGKKW